MTGTHVTRVALAPPRQQLRADETFWNRVLAWNRDDQALTTTLDMVILMTMSEPLSLATVKSHLSELVSRVNGQHERVTVTVHGKPAAVLISIDDLEALEETISLLANEESVRDLIASENELARGEVITQEELAVAMAARQQRAS